MTEPSTADTQAPNPRDCVHGQLRRKCELCELIVDNARLTAAKKALHDSRTG